MWFDARYDLDVLALQQQDDLTCLLTLTAPTPAGADERPGETVIAVLDDSASMRGARLESARMAMHQLVDRLMPQDSFGLVTFSTDARITVPVRKMVDHDRPSVHGFIEQVRGRSSTDLGAGYLLGLSLAQQHAGDSGASMLLLSDGHANSGVTDAVALGRVAAQGRVNGVTTTTIGVGDDYDESLLAALAAHGQGSHRFAHSPDDAVAVVCEEAGDLLSKSILNAFIRVRLVNPDMLPGLNVLHDLPGMVEQTASGPVLVIAMGDLYAGQQRELLVKIQVPGMESLGIAHLGDFVLDYVTLPDLAAHTLTWPITVNVVSPEDAANRVPDPSVTTARLLAEVAQAKAEAADALSSGDRDLAGELIQRKASQIRKAKEDLLQRTPDRSDLADRLDEEADHLDKLERAARERESRASIKSLVEDAAMNSRGRGDAQRRQRARGKREF